jgi:hypothetical protein
MTTIHVHHPTSVAPRRDAFTPMIAGLLLATTAAAATPQEPVPAELRGTWVAARSACDAPARMRVGADHVIFEHGSDRETLRGIEMAGPGFFQPGYSGIMAVLITEFDGQQPVTVIFNVDERKGSARAEFSPVMPGKATAQLSAYNARISKLKLATRFPLDKVLLKRCPDAKSR